MNTTGFKADGAVFEEFLMPVARHGGFQGNDQRLSFVQDRATWHDFSHGPIEQTGNPLDVAIDGDAFLVVQTPRGERYTRNGALQINATGQLVTSDGDRVLGDGGPIQFQPTDSDIVDQSGRHASRCAKAATPSPTRRAASCGWCASTRSQTLQKDGASHVPRARTASHRRPPTRARASSRARSSNRTCARSSR